MPCAWLFKRLVVLVPATALLSATRFCACAPEPFLGGWPLLPTAGPGPGPLVSTSAPWSVALPFCVAVRNLVSYFTFMRAVGAEPFLVSALRRFCVFHLFIYVAPRVGRRNLRLNSWPCCVLLSGCVLTDATRGGVRSRSTAQTCQCTAMHVCSFVVCCIVIVPNASVAFGSSIGLCGQKLAVHFCPRMVAEPSVDGLRCCPLYPPPRVGPPR